MSTQVAEPVAVTDLALVTAEPIKITTEAPPAPRDMRGGLKFSPSFARLVCALAKARGEMGPVLKDLTATVKTKTGGQYEYAYADLASVMEAITKPLSNHGLAVFQPPSTNGDKILVTTILAHESGEWVSSELVFTVEQNGNNQFIQSCGSAITYARRYGLSGLLAIASETDDDGAGAGNKRPAASNTRTTPANNPRQQGKPANQPPADSSFSPPAPKEQAPPAASTAPPPAASAPPVDPVDNLKKTLFRRFACKSKEDCDILLHSASLSDDKGLDYFAQHPEECDEALEILRVTCSTWKVETHHLLAEVIKRKEQAAAI